MRIGFIGLGIMGEAMCYNIIRKHDSDVYIYDVKTEPVQRLAEKGGIACDSAVDAAKHSDVIITMLPRSEDSLSRRIPVFQPRCKRPQVSPPKCSQ